MRKFSTITFSRPSFAQYYLRLRIFYNTPPIFLSIVFTDTNQHCFLHFATEVFLTVFNNPQQFCIFDNLSQPRAMCCWKEIIPERLSKQTIPIVRKIQMPTQ